MSENTDSAIAVLGASASGKTTFLAALYIAVLRHNEQLKDEGRTDEKLRLIGVDDASNNTLKDLTRALTTLHTFPEPTQGIEELNWMLFGQRVRLIPRMLFGFLRCGNKRVKVSTRISLNLADPAGLITREPGEGEQVSEFRGTLLKKLKESQGIVILFDPIAESTEGLTFEHTFGIILDLAREILQSDDFTGDYLPHYVAVCISKFDDPRVLQTARETDLLMTDPGDLHAFPRVADYDARELFQSLCKVSSTGTADLALNTIEDYFNPDRIKYFVTSAIGFFMAKGRGQIDDSDYQNVVEDPPPPVPGQKSPIKSNARIRGQIHPINVLEPILWAGDHTPIDAGGAV